MSNPAARRQYAKDGTGVVSNERLLIMLFDRLDRDLAEAESRCALGDRPATHDAITHAQDILYELIGALDIEAWPSAKNLQDIYVFCVNQLIEANVAQNARSIHQCRELLQPIAEAWRDASSETMTQSAEVSFG